MEFYGKFLLLSLVVHHAGDGGSPSPPLLKLLLSGRGRSGGILVRLRQRGSVSPERLLPGVEGQREGGAHAAAAIGGGGHGEGEFHFLYFVKLDKRSKSRSLLVDDEVCFAPD